MGAVAQGVYYVTASHRVPSVEPGVHSRPFGTRHARRVGVPRTACGLAALQWPIFHELRFDARVLSSCADCSATLG